MFTQHLVPVPTVPRHLQQLDKHYFRLLHIAAYRDTVSLVLRMTKLYKGMAQ